MAEQVCRNCRSWEEDMYWNHFQFHHFSQVLHAGFHRQLAIPEEFTKHLKEKLPKSISLKGPSGGVWQVDLATTDGTMFICHGWDEFVIDNLLQQNDLLIFKYNGASSFDILIFDGRSLCEKAASYFVRKCGHRDPDSSSQLRRKFREFNGAPTPEKSANDGIYTTLFKKPINTRNTSKKIRMPIEEIDPSPLPINKDFSDSDEEMEKNPDTEHISQRVVHDVPCISSRRLITAEDKRNALQLAKHALTNNGFMAVMKPTYVARKFYMSIPSSWMARHADSLEKQDVILCVGDNLWHTKYHYQKSKNSGGLSAGWKKFAMDHNLQEHDVCVFEPGCPINNALLLNVYIFRVNQDGL